MSLKLLAESLGLSKTTVSRAMAGYDDVSPDTLARVRAAAEAIGYQPNAVARRLSRGASETVAIVLPQTDGRGYESLFVDLAAAIGARLADADLDLVLTAPRPGEPELAVYQRLVTGRRADAVVLVRLREADERVSYLQRAGVPFVCFGRTTATIPYAFVDGDGERAFDEATRHLASLGHRVFAFLSGPVGAAAALRRRAGHTSALAALELAPSMLFEGASDEMSGEAMAARALAATPRPTALVCATDRIAIGALAAVRAAGLVPGRDVSIVGHDNLPVTAFTDPPLATMELQLTGVGARIADMVVALIGGAKPRDLTEVRPVNHVWRASVGPPF